MDNGRHLTTISNRRIPPETSRESLTVVAVAVAVAIAAAVVGGRREGENRAEDAFYRAAPSHRAARRM